MLHKHVPGFGGKWDQVEPPLLTMPAVITTLALLLVCFQALEWKDYTWSGLQTEGMVGHLLTDVALLVIVTGYCLITGHDIVRSIQVGMHGGNGDWIFCP
jgi:hypothetical protein